MVTTVKPRALEPEGPAVFNLTTVSGAINLHKVSIQQPVEPGAEQLGGLRIRVFWTPRWDTPSCPLTS